MMTTEQSIHDSSATVLPYRQESLLIDACAEIAGKSLICISPGLAQFGGLYARRSPAASVACYYLDLYRAELAHNHWTDCPTNLRIKCQANFSDEPCDAAALPFSAHGEAELTREFIQAACQRLTLHGKLYASTDNARDTWLGEQLATLFGKLKRRETDTGVLYVGTKTAQPRRIRRFDCEFAFRDQGRLIRAYSRPGVFSHRHIDPGARHLIETMRIAPGFRVLDLGCGAGVVALAAAFRSENVRVHAVDSNARAVECVQRGAELNGLTNVTAELNADGAFLGRGEYDLVLANPPYYSGFRIAQHFATAGLSALRPGGTYLVVTKHPGWYEENLANWYSNITRTERKGYVVFRGTRVAP